MASHVETTPLTLTNAGVSFPAREYVARALGGAIFWALLALVPLTAVPYGTVDELWQSLFQCVVLAAAALWAVEGLLSGKWFVREHRLLAPLLPFLVFVFAQSVPLGVAEVAGVRVWRAVSVSPFETRLVAFRFLALLIFAALLLRYTSSRRRLGALVCCVAGVGVASALFGVVQQATHPEGDEFFLARLLPQLSYGQFINKNHFAFLMEMCLGLLLGLLAGARRRGGQTFLCLASATVVWSALVLSSSRGGILAMLGQGALFALSYRAARFARGARSGETSLTRRSILSAAARYCAVVCLLLVVCGGVAWMGGEQLMRRVDNLRGEVSEEGAAERDYPRRAHMWQATLRMIAEHPVVGSGFGGYYLAIDRHYDASGVSAPREAHNDYLELLSSGGVVCVAPMVWFVVLFARRARRCLHSRGAFRRAACLGALLGVCAVAMHSLVDFGIHITANAVVFTSLFVLATVHVEVGRKEPGGGGERWRRLPTGRESVGEVCRRTPNVATRAAAAALCILACVVAARATARAGLSRWYSQSLAQGEDPLASTERIVRLSPSDPIVRMYRANILAGAGKEAEGLEELEHAAALDPEDHSLWLQIGFAREAAGDPGALAAFERVVQLAPFYAQPRWQLGTALLRAGRRERACAELARAAESDPHLLPQALDLLSVVFDGNAEAVERLLPPQSTTTRLALIRFFIQHDTDEALRLLRQTGEDARAERRALTATLIAAGKFAEAYEAWSSGGRGVAASGGGLSAVADGGFEGSIGPADGGFGWQVTKDAAGLTVALDTKEPRDGARSLLLDFRGEPAARSPIVSQLILVEPNTRYRLSFAARTHELMTIGPPTVELIDARGGQQLMTPTLLPRGDSCWHDYTAEFITGQVTSAVLLTVRRQECTLKPCLIYGQVWLDGFSLRKL